MTTLLEPQIADQVRSALAPITRPVEMAIYTGSGLVVPGRDQPGMETEALQLLRDVAALHPQLSVVEGKFSDPEVAALELTHSPTILLREAGSARNNLRFLGLPSGYEFSTLIETLLMLGTGESGLKENFRRQVAEVNTPVRMQAFVTPGCPYCPRAVLTAYRFALENPNILAEGVEASEFPILSGEYGIQGVPDTVVHGQAGTGRVLGGQPEHVFLEQVLKVAAQPVN